jgi:allantoin racemase
MEKQVRVAFVTSPYSGEERTGRFDAVRSRVTPDIELGIIEISGSAFISNITTGDVANISGAFIEAYIRAEREGYQAAVPLGMLDIAVDAGRCAVDIPIIGPFESSLHAASLVGTRVGLVAYTDHYLPMLYSLARQFGMSDFVVGANSVAIDPRDLMSHSPDEITQRLVAAGKTLITQNAADVIIPCGISLCPRYATPEWLSDQLGVPVVEGMGTPIHFAAACVRLGLKQSRLRWRLTGS